MGNYKHPVISPSVVIPDILDILNSGQLSGFRANKEYHLGGKYVQKLEDEFKAYHGVKYAVSFNSGTSALHAACIACGVRQGDTVVCSPFTFSASASCVLMCGAKPVFADIQENTFNVHPLNVFYAAARGTRAIIPVHLMGFMANIRSILSSAEGVGAKVIEDTCQALGATHFGKKAGTYGDCAVFSFNQSKPISTGEGGMLITKDDRIAEIARAVRNHGEVSCPELGILGYNYRMAEINAVVALHQLNTIDSMNDIRIELAERLTGGIKDIEGLTPPFVFPDCKHVFYTYAIRVDKDKLGISRDELQKKLLERGIYFGKGGLKPLHLYPIYGGKEGQFPIAERMWKEVMFTDILRYPMTTKDVDEIIRIIKEVVNEKI